MKKFLTINHLEVFSKGKIVYSQKFFKGINVLAGKNGTGKSTIVDFLAYVLGYEEIEWKEIQKQCEYVVATLSIDNNTFQLKREINNRKQNPIYFKSLIEDQNWIVLPYRNSNEKRSFSNHFFELIGIPTTKLVSGSSLTMFHLLRLIYADQNTSVDNLLNRQKEFDNKGIRKSIYEVLLGIDDFETHSIRQHINKLDKEYSSNSSEVKSIKSFLSQWQLDSPDQLSTIKKELEQEIEKDTELISNIDQESTKNDIDIEIRNNIVEIDKKMHNNIEEVRRLDEEINDSKELISLLELNTSEIDETMNFYSVFSGIDFIFCPQCLEILKENDNESECSLCKNAKPSKDKITHFYLEKRIEIDFQLRESKSLIEKKSKIKDEKNAHIKSLNIERDSLIKKLKYQQSLSNEVIKNITDISIRIGENNEKISQIISNNERVKKLNEMQKNLEHIKSEISKFDERLKNIYEQRAVYRLKLDTEIQRIVKTILQNDGGYETAFKDPKEIRLDFENSKMFVDGSSKFSASSEAILKLASRFTIFLLSLIFDEVRIPKFTILDCMEDKGMLPERAALVQQGILDELLPFKEDFQLIVATSMPCERLLEEGKIIGKYFIKGEHTIEL